MMRPGHVCQPPGLSGLTSTSMEPYIYVNEDLAHASSHRRCNRIERIHSDSEPAVNGA